MHKADPNISKDPSSLLLTVLLGIQNKLNLTDELWIYDDIAAYLKIQPKTVQNYTSKAPGFPRPTIVPGSSTRGIKRWYAKEVRNWVARHR